MRTLIIDANNFSTLEGFYKELEPSLVVGECPWGQNLDSLDEIVTCFFNYTGDSKLNVTKIIWLNFKKSETEIVEKRGANLLMDLLNNILSQNRNIVFDKR